MKLNFDFNVHFWIGLAIFISTGVSSGGIHLTHMIPDDWIPTATAWLNFLAFIGSGYLTAALGLHNASPQQRIERAATLPNTVVATTGSLVAAGDAARTTSLAAKLATMPEVQNVIASPLIADAVPSDKVVATVPDKAA